MLKLFTNDFIWRNIVSQWGSYFPHSTSLWIPLYAVCPQWDNEKVDVGHRGRYGLHREYHLYFSMKFILSELNLGMNGPCWSCSLMVLFEEIVYLDLVINKDIWRNIASQWGRYSTKMTSVLKYVSVKFFWNGSM